MGDFSNSFICGRKFQDISDFIRDTDKQPDYSNIKDKSIIWCKSDFVDELFFRIKGNSGRHILITHNSDHSITKSLFESKPSCIKKWFALNADYKHSDLIPLPIGLENDKGPSKGKYTDYKLVEENVNATKRYIDSVYCNFEVKNHHSRSETKNLLLKSGICIWSEKIDYRSYCSVMSQYQFAASPRGNGIDCHRTWEALYLGCTPIVDKHFMYNSYDLPIIQIERWSDFNAVWLRSQYDVVKNKKANYDQLKIDYWFDRIKKERDIL